MVLDQRDMEQLLELQLLSRHARGVGGGRHRGHLDDDLFHRLLPLFANPGRRCLDFSLLQVRHLYRSEAHIYGRDDCGFITYESNL